MTAVSKELHPLNNGGHKMTAVSKEIKPLDNGGHKMTAVSKEIQPLDARFLRRLNISPENFQRYSFLVN